MGLRDLNFDRVEYLGIFAGSFAILAGISQVVRLYKNKSAEDISLLALIGALFSTTIWIYYHYTKQGGGPFITTTLTLLFLIITLSLKIYYDYINGPETVETDSKTNN